MADNLIAILLVTSARDKNIIFHWPPNPASTPRLTRRLSNSRNGATSKAFHNFSPGANVVGLAEDVDEDDSVEDEWENDWTRPIAYRDRSQSFRKHSHSHSHKYNSSSKPSSGRNSPVLDRTSFDHILDTEHHFVEKEYGTLLGYPTEFLARLLSPESTLCHQKFELIVDDLAFVGHPVCVDLDGIWRFRTEPAWIFARGRGSRASRGGLVQDSGVGIEPVICEADVENDVSSEADSADAEELSKSISPALRQFHVVLVLNVPAPSFISSHSTQDLSKYIHIIYEQLAFIFTATLFQEQVQNGYMEKECDRLGDIREGCIRRDETFSDFLSKALEASQLARAIKSVYEAIVTQEIARIKINESGVELQLPPSVDSPFNVSSDVFGDEGPRSSLGLNDIATTHDPSYNWRLPELQPWKSILLLDMEAEKDQLIVRLSNPGLILEDQEVYEELIEFLQGVSVFETLADISVSLGWSLENKLYPLVRWLVYHRKAKIVDRVHIGLKNVFLLSDEFDFVKIVEMTSEFEKDFPFGGFNILPFPQLLSRISSQAIFNLTSDKAGAPEYHRSVVSSEHRHFFASCVQSKHLLPIYRDVIVWMLKREIIILVHLRIRIVATKDIKQRVELARGRMENGDEEKKYGGGRDDDDDKMTGGSGLSSLFSSHSKVRTHSHSQSRGRSRRRSSSTSYNTRSSTISSMILEKREKENGSRRESESNNFANSNSHIDEKLQGVDDTAFNDNEKEGEDFERDFEPSIILNPAQPSQIERAWLGAMCEGMERDAVTLFERASKYFDGRTPSDEIMYRADMSRREMKDVLGCFGEYLITFLHP